MAPPRRFWPKPASRAGRIALWIAVSVLGSIVLRLIFGGGGVGDFFGSWIDLGLLVLAPLALVLLLRSLNRRLLWKVRNRLIVTYVLMGLAPVVLFGTLIAITSYVFAGQYAINSALAGFDQATDQLKSEAAQLAGGFSSVGQLNPLTAIGFDEEGNSREQVISAALVQGGLLHSLHLQVREQQSPASPFDGAALPSWMRVGFHGAVAWKGKVFLCRLATSTHNDRSSEVLTALELNQHTLASVGQSLGRVLLFSGSTKARHQDIDNAEHEAQTAEQEADLAETQREAEEQRREAERDQQQALRDQQQASQDERQALREGADELHQAQREVDQAQREVQRTEANPHADTDDRQDAQQSFAKAQQELQRAQREMLGIPEPPIPVAPVPPDVVPPRARPVKPPSAEPLHAAPSSQPPGADTGSAGQEFTAISGGALPQGHWFDPRVYFTAPLPVTTWQDGHQNSAMLVVISRPSALYTRLFSTSVEMGSLLRNALVAMAIGFGLLELLALWMATRLSGTITRSVADLYAGTTEIDKGNLQYRVQPHRPDQLGALAGSFNRMAGSIQDLLVQQREKDRLLNELAIAQEVQQNLFPHSPVSISGLEMHAVCLPARSVSGDYFDFIVGHNTLGKGTGACIALGDISGKGISAALLMATLHSAVRAFSLRGEGHMPSPAQQLELLNQHLFASTQPNRYATLFLAFYDAVNHRLTYANGGHLPPFLLSANGGVRRLDVGGAVVGLLENMRYEEATVELQPGDLLAAFTDGITEPENQKEQEFGETRLLDDLGRNRTLPLPLLADKVLGAVLAWNAGQEQPDDMTLLLARLR